ncbi:MAG: hypothetical protein V4850_14555 [Myxococcota bacterium]
MRLSLPTLAAVLFPALVLLAAGAWLTTEPIRELSPEGALNDEALERAQPGILIVGNSKSRSDVDAQVLKKSLGYQRPILTVLVAGSSAPAWYAILEQRVFANGHRPEIVIVYGQLAAMLRVEADSAGEGKRLEGQMDAPSEVISRKVLRNSTGPLGLMRRNATAAHDALLAGIREFAVGTLLAPPADDGVRAAGKRVADPALETMFGSTARFREGGGARVVPVAERAFSHAMTASDVTAEESLLPDLITVAEANGARVVFVRAPLPASTRYTDSLAPAVEGAALDLMNQRGVSYIDLQGIDLPLDAWRDHIHLSGSGKAAVTAALAAAMKEAKILEGGVAPARPVLLASSVVRVGTPPPVPAPTFLPAPKRACGFQAPMPDFAFLSDDLLQTGGFGRSSPLVLVDAAGAPVPRSAERDLGETCVGGWQHRKFGAIFAPSETPVADGLTMAYATEPSLKDARGNVVWWVYPGTTTEWRYDAPVVDGAIRVSVSARLVKGSTATLRVGDKEVPLEAEGRLYRAEIEVPALAAPWSIGVSAGADTWLVIDELALGSRRMVGAPAVTLAPLVSPVVAAVDPPAVATGAAGTDGDIVTLAVPGLGQIADDALRTRIDYPCSPLQVAPESAPDAWLTEAHLLEGMLRGKVRRGFGQFGDTLRISPPGETMPAGPYRVRLDPLRACGRATWLYPGDELSWAARNSSDRLRLGADLLVLEGISLLAEHDERAAVPIVAKVRVTDPNREQVVEAEVELPATGGFSRKCVYFDEPFPPGARMELTLSNPDRDAWFIIWNAHIGESEHLPGCDE